MARSFLHRFRVAAADAQKAARIVFGRIDRLQI